MEAFCAPCAFSIASSSSAAPAAAAAAAAAPWRLDSSRWTVPRARLRTNNGVSVSELAPRRRLRCNAVFSGGVSPEIKESLDKFVNEHKVVVFMKGTKLFPQCGFSNTVVQILNNLNVPYETVNILEDEALRQNLKAYSSWPTFPQLYIDGEFFGGCDITLEAFQSGQLKEVLEKAMCS